MDTVLRTVCCSELICTSNDVQSFSFDVILPLVSCVKDESTTPSNQLVVQQHGAPCCAAAAVATALNYLDVFKDDTTMTRKNNDDDDDIIHKETNRYECSDVLAIYAEQVEKQLDKGRKRIGTILQLNCHDHDDELETDNKIDATGTDRPTTTTTTTTGTSSIDIDGSSIAHDHVRIVEKCIVQEAMRRYSIYGQGKEDHENTILSSDKSSAKPTHRPWYDMLRKCGRKKIVMDILDVISKIDIDTTAITSTTNEMKDEFNISSYVNITNDEWRIAKSISKRILHLISSSNTSHNNNSDKSDNDGQDNGHIIITQYDTVDEKTNCGDKNDDDSSFSVTGKKEGENGISFDINMKDTRKRTNTKLARKLEKRFQHRKAERHQKTYLDTTSTTSTADPAVSRRDRITIQDNNTITKDNGREENDGYFNSHKNKTSHDTQNEKSGAILLSSDTKSIQINKTKHHHQSVEWDREIVNHMKRVAGLFKLRMDQKPSTAIVGNSSIIQAVQNINNRLSHPTLSPDDNTKLTSEPLSSQRYRLIARLATSRVKAKTQLSNKAMIYIHPSHTELQKDFEWQCLRQLFNAPNCVLIYHLKNHYCPIYAVREYTYRYGNDLYNDSKKNGDNNSSEDTELQPLSDKSDDHEESASEVDEEHDDDILRVDDFSRDDDDKEEETTTMNKVSTESTVNQQRSCRQSGDRRQVREILTSRKGQSPFPVSNSQSYAQWISYDEVRDTILKWAGYGIIVIAKEFY